MSSTSISLALRQAVLLSALLFVCLGACSAESGSSASAQRLATGQAMFAERCKTAGEKIYRTVAEVEGIYLLKVRPNHVNYGESKAQQFALDDPYGHDLGGNGYVESFVRGSFQANSRGTPVPGSPPRIGYLYVEAIDSNDGKRYRYTGEVREYEATTSRLGGGDGMKFKTTGFVLDKTIAPGVAPRYGVTYEDISTHEDREYWIAGSSLKVIDLQTNEVLAERVGYMMDPGQGSTAGGRAPWLFAADRACPSFARNPLLPLPPGQGAGAQLRQAQDFAEKVLKPKLTKGE